MEPVQTISYKNHTISIHYDSNAESPRTWDNLAEFHCSHRRYSLGDKGFNYSSGSDCINAAKEAEKQGDIALPFYLYDHSGITISLSPFNCPWDSGQVGFVIIRRENMLKEFNSKRFTTFLKKRALNIAQSEVEIYDQFLRGEIYGYQIDDDNGDSCWGFYGQEECLNEAKSVVDSMVEVEV